ncbi:MAG: class I SAM-dependent methyltransferase, partial [bacterium]
MDHHEVKDKELFNSIATTYFRKDIYPVSSYARKFQLLSLFELLPDQKNKKLDAILELGCGVGASASYLKGLYEHYTGIDYSEAFVNIARNHFSDNKTNFLCLNLKDYKKEPEKIDFV